MPRPSRSASSTPLDDFTATLAIGRDLSKPLTTQSSGGSGFPTDRSSKRRSGGARNYNWSSIAAALEDEHEIVKADLDSEFSSEELDAIDTDYAYNVKEPLTDANDAPIAIGDAAAQYAKLFRKDVFKKGNSADLASIARTSAGNSSASLLGTQK